LLNECGFITDAEKSMNCSKNSRFGLTTFVLLFTLSVSRIYHHAPSLSQAFGAQKKSGINTKIQVCGDLKIISLPYPVTSH